MVSRNSIVLGFALAAAEDFNKNRFPALYQAGQYTRALVEHAQRKERLLVELGFLRKLLGLPRNCDRGLTLDQMESLAESMLRGDSTPRR
jgi:hypothetical protein